jgi:hypothetical protein
MTPPKKTADMPFPVAAMWAVIGAGILVVLGVFLVPALWVELAYRPAEAVVLDRRWAERHGTKATYSVVEALLAYQADGQEYQAWVELPLEAFRGDSKAEAEAIFNKVQVGQHMICYHDPLHPEIAAASRDRWHWGYLLGLAFGGICLFAGVVLMAASWRTTFPRGAGTATADLLRRLSLRFWLAAAGALMCAGVGFLAVRNMGPAALDWPCLVLPAAAAAVVLLLRWVFRYGAMALPSAEKRAAAASADLPAVTAKPPVPPGWSQAKPVEVQRGERLPVRLSATPTGDFGCFVLGIGAFMIVAVLTYLLGWMERQGWVAPVPPALRPLQILLSLAAVGVVVIVACWRAASRVGKLAVEASAHPFQAGGRYELAVSYPEPECLRGLQLDLVCEEQRGKGKGTKHATPLRQPITLGPPSQDGATRTGWLELPPRVPISFALENNQVRWNVEVCTSGLRGWKASCPVTVAPGRIGDRPPPSAAAQPLRLDEEALSLWIDGKGLEFPVGTTLSGGYAVHAREAAGPLRTVELSVLWHADAPGGGDLGVCHYEEHAAEDGDDLPLYAPRQYRVRLPDGPPSYHGKAVRVQWAVRLRLRYVNGTEVLHELPFRLVIARAEERPGG